MDAAAPEAALEAEKMNRKRIMAQMLLARRSWKPGEAYAEDSHGGYVNADDGQDPQNPSIAYPRPERHAQTAS